MRSHCEELKLCDLRRVTSSEEMVTELIRGVSVAFNGGSVQPTVFVFPPRNVNARGPMIWNHQVLQFAGYEIDGGTVLGDPMSVEITNAMMDLGWQPVRQIRFYLCLFETTFEMRDLENILPPFVLLKQLLLLR